LGDSNRSLADGVNRFFLLWNEFLVELLDQANQAGKSAWRIDSDALSRLVICSIEGALLLCKASKDPDALKRTGDALKSVVRLCRKDAGQGLRSHDFG
jgi:hypothetical protein